jgi:hypothetical protein
MPFGGFSCRFVALGGGGSGWSFSTSALERMTRALLGCTASWPAIENLIQLL